MKLLKYLKIWTLVVLLAACTVTPALAVGENGTNTGDGTDAANYTAVNELVYALAQLDVYSGPGPEYDSVGTMKYGESLRRIGVGDNGWSQVTFAGKTAYIASERLSVTRPAANGGSVDTAALRTQMVIANGLRKSDYTAQSWAELQKALDKAETVQQGESQQTVDEATQELKDAIAALQKMDYSRLENTLTAAETFQNDDELNELRRQLEEAVAEGRDMLTAADQEAVDASAVKIYDLLVQLQEELEKREKPGTIVQEVQVQVLPTDDYCNVSGHRLWQALFFVALLLNVCFAAAAVTYWLKKTRLLQRDDTPLVDYDIDDDAF